MPVSVQLPDEGFNFHTRREPSITTMSPVTGSAATEQQVGSSPGIDLQNGAVRMVLTAPEESIL